MAFATNRSHALFNKCLITSQYSKTFQFFHCFPIRENQFTSYVTSKTIKGCNGLSEINRSVHNATHDDTGYENLFRINVIEIDNKGNAENKNLRLETLVNELKATEKLKLEKLLKENLDHDMYNWNNEERRMERKSIRSKEYQKQKRSQLPLRDLRMFFRHINLGK